MESQLPYDSAPFQNPQKHDPFIWTALLLAWFLLISLLPDPRPLGAPDWAVNMMRSLGGFSEPVARAVATIVLRASGIGVLGILLSLVLLNFRVSIAAPAVLIGTVVLAIGSMWINYGYFPIIMQIQLAVVSSIVGALVGMVLRRSKISLAVLIIFLGGLFAWGTSTGISNDLDQAARATGLHLLENADDIPDADDGFKEILRRAFQFAADNAGGTDAVEQNKAAILALGVILGEEHIASVAGREIDGGRRKEIAKLDRRISIQGRTDLSRHFWLSAAFTILSDQSRSMDVGITKELMDATAGGSGFSFVDLTADQTGTLFAKVATRDVQSARELQLKIRHGIEITDFFPDVTGLPEGIYRDEFQAEYGGLGGTETTKILKEIRRRLTRCPILDFDG